MTLPLEARHIFNIWVERPELRWADMAWRALATKGLVGPQVERELNLLRLLALGALYHTFNWFAWQEGSIQLGEWASDVGLTSSELRSLVEGSSELETPDDLLQSLVEEQARLVRQTLLEAVGESLPFASLWLSRDPDWAGLSEIPDEVLSDVLNEDVFDKGAAFDWLTSNGRLEYV